jgi:hypothetical protein
VVLLEAGAPPTIFAFDRIEGRYDVMDGNASRGCVPGSLSQF